MRYDVLNLEWSSSGRDIEATGLVSFALREKGYSVKEASIFNWRYYLAKYQPRLLFINSSEGAKVNFQVGKYATQLGIPFVTLMAEGDLRPDEDKMIWGNNTDRILYEVINCQWSERARDICHRAEPSLKDKIKVSGGVGFDRYKIYGFLSRKEFMEKYRKDYSAVIGLAGWAFERINWPKAKLEKLIQRFVDVGYSEEVVRRQMARYRLDGLELNKILRNLIQNNPETLFLLKYHPGIVDKSQTEFAGLEENANVVAVKNEESIGDCINVSDIWMAYESTTCLEAWLRDKPTLLVNPSGPDFMFRSSVHRGSPVFETSDQVQEAIERFNVTGNLSGFTDKAPLRQQIIKDTIQWADGKNHMRAAYFIDKVLKEHGDKPRMNPPVVDHLKAYVANFAFNGARYFPGLPVFRRFAHAHERFKENELDELTERYRPYLEKYHRQHPLTEDDVKELEEINQVA